MTEAGSVERAVHAATAIACEHGIEVSEPRLLSTRQAVIVHLTPAPLVARVGVEDVFGPRLEWQRGAVGLVRHLADAGAPVVPPTDLLPPGPYEVDGLVVSFWGYVEEEPSAQPDPRAAGEALCRIHELALTYQGELAAFWPLDEIRSLLERPEVERSLAGNFELVERAAAELASRLPMRPEQPLHGDAHIWNTLPTQGGLLWFDFDEACRGPLEWDAATMIESDWVFGPREEVRAAYSAAFGDRFDERELAPWVELRALMIVLWTAVHSLQDAGVAEELDDVLAWLRPRIG